MFTARVHIALILSPLMPVTTHAADGSTQPAATRPTMKAVRVQAFGGVEVLKLEDAPRPTPKDDEVLVRVIAAGVNPVDAGIRKGRFGRHPHAGLPFVPGLDIAGVVEESGAKVTTLKKGDAVYAFVNMQTQGGYAEYAVAKESEASPKPRRLTFAHAAGVPLAGLTAWQALVEIAQLEPGQTVLIHGGSGGVGSHAIQIAKARGATVIATASVANQELLLKLGADVAIDYRAQKFEDIARDVDVILDTVGGDTLARSYDVLKKGGIVVSLVAQPDEATLKGKGHPRQVVPRPPRRGRVG